MRRPPDPQRFHHAVIVVAKLRARRVVKDQIRAKGLKVSHYTAREISEQAEEYMAAHAEELVAKATADCLTFPEFANLRTNAPTQNPQTSMGSALQMSGAK